MVVSTFFFCEYRYYHLWANIFRDFSLHMMSYLYTVIIKSSQIPKNISNLLPHNFVKYAMLAYEPKNLVPFSDSIRLLPIVIFSARIRENPLYYTALSVHFEGCVLDLRKML